MRKKNKLSAKWIYIVGLIIWAITCILLIVVSINLTKLSLRNILFDGVNWLYLISFGVYPFIALMLNLWIWWDEKQYCLYPIEVDIIKFVERNSNYLVFAITAICIVAQAVATAKSVALKPSNVAFTTTSIPLSLIVYIGVSVTFLLLSLTLVWIPPEKNNAAWLVRLRHIKTLPYILSISFLLSAVVSLCQWCIGR